MQPELERRAKETTFTEHVVETLIGKQSRKVAFGIWGFMIGNAFLTTDKITNQQWLIWSCFMASLIGFGTILDDVIAKFGDKLATTAAKKVDSMTIEVTKTTETNTDAPPPAA